MGENRGWKIERQQFPDSLHFSLMAAHTHSRGQLLTDLEECTTLVKGNQHDKSSGSAAMFGMVGKIPDKTLVDDFILQFFGKVFKVTTGTKPLLNIHDSYRDQ